ncbi:uncharacterized protein LOC6559621 [Drosophila grimshawi]|uniref:GH21441 n=1 Tax=Drosophila grimshawi TaxID=7222 RepID=B4J9F7_DROGR|nr:uncharacterized protein LOC6559621 [Drosophila grimshawi]EDW01438.1 GH21441 [Drosophila grimshawi]
MQLITKVILLAATVLSASAWPHTAAETSLLRMVIAQLGSPLSEARSLTPPEINCVNKHTNSSNMNHDEMTNATSKCEETYNSTLVANSQNRDVIGNQIRSQVLTLQNNLQKCTNESENLLLINCTIAHFDENLKLLDSSNSLAYQIASQHTSNSTIVKTQRANCISSAVSQYKVNSIEAANDFDKCMAMAPNQRELPAQKEKMEQVNDVSENQAEKMAEKQPENLQEQTPVEQAAKQSNI